MNSLLLIEDNLDCARLVQKVLTPHGYLVHHAATGAMGLQMARDHQAKDRTPLSLILLDINLPDMNGHAVVLHLRRALRLTTTPIVAFTAETGSQAKRTALAHGCDGFLNKPINTKTFPSEIEAFMKMAYTYL